MKTVWRMVVPGLVAGALVATPSAAVDVPITGLKLKVSDATQPGTARRKIIAGSRDLAIVIPADGSAGDPSLHGGVIEVENSAGSGESVTFALPAGNWQRVPGNPAFPLKGWKYKEVVENPPAEDYKIKVLVKQTSSSAVLRLAVKDDRGSLISYTLDEPAQGSIALRLATGADRHCTDFGGTIAADESEDLGDGVYRGKFLAKEAPAPPDCGSPSGAFVD